MKSLVLVLVVVAIAAAYVMGAFMLADALRW